jgi:hypothetical protein
MFSACFSVGMPAYLAFYLRLSMSLSISILTITYSFFIDRETRLGWHDKVATVGIFFYKLLRNGRPGLFLWISIWSQDNPSLFQSKAGVIKLFCPEYLLIS